MAMGGYSAYLPSIITVPTRHDIQPRVQNSRQPLAKAQASGRAHPSLRISHSVVDRTKIHAADLSGPPNVLNRPVRPGFFED